MKKTELKKLIKEAFLTEKKSNLLNENSPGFDNRKQGEPLPTLESIKAAYQAKKLEEKAEDTKEETEATKELTAAVKDLDDAKKEAGLNEDRFVDASLDDLEQVVRNLAHTTGMGIEEAAEMAMTHIENMFMGGNDEEELEEGANIRAHDEMNAAAKKTEELIKIANELFPEIAKEQEGGELVNFIPLSNEQRDEVYREYVKLNEVEIAEATELPKDIKWEFNDVIDQMDAYNATISLTGYSESTGKDYTASAEASRGGSGGDWDWMEVDEVEEEPIDESVITEADMIIESFKK